MNARARYEALVASLDETNAFQPRYLILGPTGRCALRCPECIIGGAIFDKGRQVLRTAADVIPYLAEAEAAGVRQLSFCIGEPTFSRRILYEVLDRVRTSPTLTVRSLVSNGLLGRHLPIARRFFEDLRAHLGEDKARALLFGLSLNDDLRAQGITEAYTANMIEAFGAVFPGRALVLQVIQGEGFHRIQNALIAELGARGLLADAEAKILPSEGTHPRLELENGTTLIVSAMRRQPSLHLASAPNRTADPWVRTIPRAVLEGFPLKGLYTYEEEGVLPVHGEELSVHRLTLGPDGLLYPDYHFMVAGTRPLGRHLSEAISTFRRDPILGLLLERGGLNALLATYQAIPASERKVEDLIASALCCTTPGMVAANVIFGDWEVALQLLERLLTCGLSVPAVA